MKYALVTLGWNPNLSPGIVSRKAFYSVDGGAPTTIEATGVEQVSTQIKASSSVVFWTVITDDEGNEVVSEHHAFSVGDGEAPQADTGLFHSIDGWVEVPDEPVDPVDPVDPNEPVDPNDPENPILGRRK